METTMSETGTEEGTTSRKRPKLKDRSRDENEAPTSSSSDHASAVRYESSSFVDLTELTLRHRLTTIFSLSLSL